jgi:hypothetical protein
MSQLEAALTPQENGTLKCSLANRTGHPEDFRISGVVPEVTIGLDGNTRYSVNLSPDPEAAIVEVRHQDEGGDVLAYRALER